MCSRTTLRIEFAAACVCACLIVAAAPSQAAKAGSAEKKDPPIDAPSAEKIKEFLKFRTDPEKNVRADQAERLSVVDHPEAVRLLCKYSLRDEQFKVRESAIKALSLLKSPEALAETLAGLKSSADEVRGGCAMALCKMEGRPENAIREVAAVLRGGGKEDLRVQLCQALGFSKSKDATQPLIEALGGGPPEAVAVAAADALALLKEPAAAAALIGMLKGGTWRTQVAAIEALSAIRVKESVEPLIEYLTNAEGRPRDDARMALEKITTNTFGMNSELWRSWWERNKGDWKVPPEPTTKPQEVRDGYGRKEIKYHSIRTFSRKLLFVFDVSSSMLDYIKVKRGREAEDARNQASRKIDLMRYELKLALKQLDPECFFNLCAFETDIRPWKKEPVRATAEAIAEAVQWAEHQTPRTAGTGEGRSSGGLDENGWMKGRTNTYGALKYIFGLPQYKKGQGGITGRPKPVNGCDTVYFLTDGEPTEGETTDVDEILNDVEAWNKAAKVVIHTIGMEQSHSLTKLLTDLAQRTGGKSVFVGE